MESGLDFVIRLIETGMGYGIDEMFAFGEKSFEGRSLEMDISRVQSVSLVSAEWFLGRIDFCNGTCEDSHLDEMALNVSGGVVIGWEVRIGRSVKVQ